MFEFAIHELLQMLFVSFGSLILHRLPPAMTASLDALVRDANAQLQQDARPLFRVREKSKTRTKNPGEMNGAHLHKNNGRFYPKKNKKKLRHMLNSR